MPSTLTWIDHDSKALDRSLRILYAYETKESRDELGIGGIRDSFADQLFPGTSSNHRALKYMLLVPWIYMRHEKNRVSAGKFANLAEKDERRLIITLNDPNKNETGTFGGRSGSGLKQLPSSVYWSALGVWQIRKNSESREQYHNQIDRFYQLREKQCAQIKEQEKNSDEIERTVDPLSVTWDRRLPDPPNDFIEKSTTKLTGEEAKYLCNQLQNSKPDSLFAHLACNCEYADISEPWNHPDYSTFNEDHKELLEHAKIFSNVIHGAYIVYNTALASLRDHSELNNSLLESFKDWLEEIEINELSDWSLSRFWDITLDKGHKISSKTRKFVKEWLELVKRVKVGDNDVDFEKLIAKIKERESITKGQKSRFTNQRLLDEWKGASGLTRMTYRWKNANSFLRDLSIGLKEEGWSNA